MRSTSPSRRHQPYLGLSTGHLARLLRKGEIEGIKPARDWLVSRSAVMAYLRQERKPGPKARDPRSRH